MSTFSEIKLDPIHAEEAKLQQVFAQHREVEAARELAAVDVAVAKLKLNERDQLAQMLSRAGFSVTPALHGSGGSLILTLPSHNTGADDDVEFFFNPDGTLRDVESR